jgi:hypothetical protein
MRIIWAGAVLAVAVGLAGCTPDDSFEQAMDACVDLEAEMGKTVAEAEAWCEAAADARGDEFIEVFTDPAQIEKARKAYEDALKDAFEG